MYEFADIQMTPVDSSNIEAIGHHPESNTLRVKFLTGATYDYHDVPPESYQALVNAPSAGSHFHKHIKGQHHFTKL
jgi:hypothetical protein